MATQLQRLRTLVLYLLSVHAAGVALIAWSEAPALAVTVAAGGLAAGILAGEAAALRFSAGGWWARNRAMAAAMHAAAIAFGLLVAALAPEVAVLRALAVLFAAAQVVAVMASAWSRTALAALANAMVLVTLATFAGGAIASVAVVGSLVLQAAFLGFDHFARTLAAHPPRRIRLAAAAAREIARALVPPAALLLALLWLAPPQPHRGIDWGATREEREATAAAYRLLGLLALIGGGGVYLVRKVLRPAGEAEPLLEESIEGMALADEPLPEPPARKRRIPAGARGRVVRAYLDFLAQAARLGWLRPPHLTAREFAAGVVRETAGPIGGLTDLFVRARYEPDEPSDDDARAAEAAAHEALASLRGRTARIVAGSR